MSRGVMAVTKCCSNPAGDKHCLAPAQQPETPDRTPWDTQELAGHDEGFSEDFR